MNFDIEGEGILTHILVSRCLILFGGFSLNIILPKQSSCYCGGCLSSMFNEYPASLTCFAAARHLALRSNSLPSLLDFNALSKLADPEIGFYQL